MAVEDMLPAHHVTPIREITKQTLERVHLPKAIERIVWLVENSKSERIQLAAAIFVAEQVMGKAKQVVEDEGDKNMALAMAQALRQVIEESRQKQLPAPVTHVEGTAHVLKAGEVTQFDTFPEALSEDAR
jgi:hypothetical protein